MANYQHILMAIDFTDLESNSVLGRATELALQNGAKLSLIHVVEYTGTMYTGEIPLPEDIDLDQRLAEQAREKLRRLVETNHLQETESFVEIGIPKREIVRVAEEQNVDLVILGSHGRHGLQLLLGSTANGVLHLAGCDVLAVRVGK
ncbi:MAG: universal stress protein [Candidatus Sedimenticola sp. PURPLELP]